MPSRTDDVRPHSRIAFAALLCAVALSFLVWSWKTNNITELLEQPLFIPGEPRMVASTVAARRADYVLDDELVLGFLVDGRPRAYPLSFLSFGEHVNDRVGHHPVLATW